MRALILLALLALPATAQVVQQSGTVTPGHVPIWATNGVVRDGGAATAGALTELGITKNGGCALGINSGPINSAYQQLCFDVSTTGGATISLQKNGSAPAAPITFTINGTQVLQLSGTTGGFATVTGSPATGDCAKFTSATSIGDFGGSCGGLTNIAANTILGNNTGSTTAPIALTRLQTLNLLGLLTNAVAEGADPTGIVDSTAAINAAIATCAAYIPAGTYKTVSALTTGSCQNLTLIGAGPNVTTINLASTTAKGFVNTALSGVVSGFRITRTGTAATGATGMDFQATTDQMRIASVLVDGHYDGIVLGSAYWGEVYDVASQNNYGNGFLMQNNSSDPVLQWNLLKIDSQANNHFGFYITTTGSAPVTVQPWINITSFANSSGGAWFVAGNSSAPIEGIFISDSDNNQDGSDEWYFATQGTKTIMMVNDWAALAGQGPTGRGLGTSASHTGNGINTDVANQNIVLTNVIADGNSFHGINLGSQNFFSLTNITSSNNSRATTDTYDGVAVAGSPDGTITGGLFANLNGNNTQRYGLNFANASGITVAGGAALGNATNPVEVASGTLTCFGLQGYSSCSGGGGGVSITAGTGIATSPSTITGTGSVALAAINNGLIMANYSGMNGVPPSPTSIYNILDQSYSGTTGSLLIRSGGSPNWVSVAAGTSGTVLTSNGATSVPSWQALAGTGTVTSVSGNNGLTGTVTSAGSIGLATIGAGGILSNATTGSALPVANSLNTLLNFVFGNPSPQGAIPFRNASNWTTLNADSFGFGSILTSGGASSNPTFTNEFSPTGSASHGIDLTGLTSSGSQIHLPNSTFIDWVFGGGTVGIDVDSSGGLLLGAGSAGIGLLNNTVPEVDNMYQLGSTTNRWTEVWAVNGTIQTSDARAKHDIRPSDLGLDFILKTRPVSFAYNGAADDGHRHYGVTVQQLESVLGAKDFGGIHKPAKPEEMAGLNYDELIGPLIKSVQELSTQVKQVKAANDNLRRQVATLKRHRK